jgi:hypothetical protein
MGAGQKAAGMAGSDDKTSGQNASDASDNPQALLAIAEELVGLGTWSWQRGSNSRASSDLAAGGNELQQGRCSGASP